jgi:hypothetical protein
VGGTQAHIDIQDGKFGFGNFNPYGEIGIVAPLSPTGPWLTTMSIEGASFYNYLAPSDERLQLLWILKFGIGYDLH